MNEEKDGPSVQDTNWIKQILTILGYIVGKGVLRKVGTGITLWGILTGDWFTILVGLVTRLVPSIQAITSQRDAAVAQVEEQEEEEPEAPAKEHALAHSAVFVRSLEMARMTVKANEDDPDHADPLTADQQAVLQTAEYLGL
jgi:hypothetical protein